PVDRQESPAQDGASVSLGLSAGIAVLVAGFGDQTRLAVRDSAPGALVFDPNVRPASPPAGFDDDRVEPGGDFVDAAGKIQRNDLAVAEGDAGQRRVYALRTCSAQHLSSNGSRHADALDQQAHDIGERSFPQTDHGRTRRNLAALSQSLEGPIEFGEAA